MVSGSRGHTFRPVEVFTSLDVFLSLVEYRISKPSKGVDAMFQVTYTPRKSLSMYFNYRYKQKERDVTGTSGAVIELSITITPLSADLYAGKIYLSYYNRL